MRKYDVSYFYCDMCGFLQTEEPFWLPESYHESITLPDTGGLLRSLALAEIISVLIYFIFDRSARYLDYAGGHGLFTRRMRDIGFDFFWRDRYSPNLLASGFEYTEDLGSIELITSFESFEHFSDPIKEIETMLALSRNIIFTTDLLPSPVPQPEDWYYYGLPHGQHISFYSLRTLQYIADRYRLKLYSVYPLHILTPKNLSSASLKLLLRLRGLGLFLYVKRKMRSRTVDDSIVLDESRRC
ncbi:MAG: class I SAM-dependent methyltransferase [Thermodesulfovibrionales bacterium]